MKTCWGAIGLLLVLAMGCAGGTGVRQTPPNKPRLATQPGPGRRATQRRRPRQRPAAAAVDKGAVSRSRKPGNLQWFPGFLDVTDSSPQVTLRAALHPCECGVLAEILRFRRAASLVGVCSRSPGGLIARNQLPIAAVCRTGRSTRVAVSNRYR